VAAPDVAPLVGEDPTYSAAGRHAGRRAIGTCGQNQSSHTPPPSRATTRATSALRRSPINCPGHLQPSSAVPSSAESCTACSSSYSARLSGESTSPRGRSLQTHPDLRRIDRRSVWSRAGQWIHPGHKGPSMPLNELRDDRRRCEPWGGLTRRLYSPSGRRSARMALAVPRSQPRARKAAGMETIRWRSADLDAAYQEAQAAGTLVLVDFFSPT
jgi:hypothetical protein